MLNRGDWNGINGSLVKSSTSTRNLVKNGGLEVEIGGEADAFTNRMRPFLGFVSIEVEQEQNKEKS